MSIFPDKKKKPAPKPYDPDEEDEFVEEDTDWLKEEKWEEV